MIFKNLKKCIRKAFPIALAATMVAGSFTGLATTAQAALPDEMEVKKGAWVNYSDEGLGSGVRTARYTYDADGKSYKAVCITPSKTGPKSGTVTSEAISSKSVLAKVLYYGGNYPDSKETDYFQSDRYTKLLKKNNWKKLSEDGQLIIQHIAGAKAAGSSDWAHGANSKAQTIAKDLIDWVTDECPDLPDSDIWWTYSGGTVANNYTMKPDTKAGVDGKPKLYEAKSPTAASSSTDKYWTSAVLTLRVGNVDKDVKVSLPAKTWMYKVVKNKNGDWVYDADKCGEPWKGGSDGKTVTVEGGTSVRIMYNVKTTDVTTATSIPIKMQSEKPQTFKAVKLYPENKKKQLLASVYPEHDPVSRTIKMEINTHTNIKVKKTDSNGNPLAGAVFGLYSDRACTKLVKQMPATGTDGYAKVDDLDFDGSTLYVVELVAPEGYALDDSVHTMEIDGQPDSDGYYSCPDFQDDLILGLRVYKSGEALTGATPVDGGLSLTWEERYQPGATFYIWNTENGKPVGDPFDDVTTNASGFGDFEIPAEGTYYVQEMLAPNNYTINGTGQYVAVTNTYNPTIQMNGATLVMKNDYQKVRVRVSKLDGKTKNPLAGAKFGLYSAQAITGYDGNVVIPAGTLMETAISGNDGIAMFQNRIPLGFSYSVKEIEPPDGYWFGEQDQTWTFTADYKGQDIQEYYVDGGVPHVINQPYITGTVDVTKYEGENDAYDSSLRSTPQGNGELVGAVYGIYAAENIYHPDKITGLVHEKGALVKSAAMGQDLKITFDQLFLGEYYIQEIKAPVGYQLDPKQYKVTIAQQSDSKNTGLVKVSTEVPNVPKRGGISINKTDYEVNHTDGLDPEGQPLGGASLEGAEFELVNKSKHAVLVDVNGNGTPYDEGERFAPDAVINTFTTDKDGNITTPDDYLPYGSYLFRETKAPEGYLHQGDLETTFDITEHGETVNKKSTGSISNPVKRGDFRLRKIDSDTQRSMAGVKFQITSNTTGESHIFTTDVNGEYDSSSAVNPHSRNTNGGEDGDGLWFGQVKSGELVPVYDDYGALPYDEYTIKELPSGEVNAGKRMFEGTLTIYKDLSEGANAHVDLGNIENTDIVIGTKAVGTDSGKHTITADGKASITDVVSLQGLEKGKKYILKGTLMDKETQEPVMNEDGTPVTAEKEFTAKMSGGEQEMVFEFDASELEGHDLVVFEELYEVPDTPENPDTPETPDEPLATEKDFENPDQTVTVEPKPEIEIGTKAVGTDSGEHTVIADGKASITDVVTLKGLEVGRKYTLKGTLMDKETQAPVTNADGTPVTAEKEFTATSEVYEEEIVFEFDATQLVGHPLVVFEELYTEDTPDTPDTPEEPETPDTPDTPDEPVASEKDFENPDQTVTVEPKPEIHTLALDSTSLTHVAAMGDTSILDEVTYSGLMPGQEYTIEGVLMDKATGEVYVPEAGNFVEALKDFIGNILGTDKGVTASVTFTPEESDGTVTLEFPCEVPAGKALVAFEYLYTGTGPTEENPEPVAQHSDIESAEQTVWAPELHTNATVDGQHVAAPGKDTVLEDEVSYKNLVVGESYVVRGKLYNKETGKPFKVDGKEVTAEQEFVAESTEGSVVLTFTFDSSKLDGKALVAFEDLYVAADTDGDGTPDKDVHCGTHSDLSDEGQTVSFKEDVDAPYTDSDEDTPDTTEEVEAPYNDNVVERIVDSVKTMDNIIPIVVCAVVAAGAIGGVAILNKKRKKA